MKEEVMRKVERVKCVLEAIADVKGRIQLAMDDYGLISARELGGDLNALEACLVTEVSELIKEMEIS